MDNLLRFTRRKQLRHWLEENHATESSCWVVMTRSKHPVEGVLPYIDVVEEALCRPRKAWSDDRGWSSGVGTSQGLIDFFKRSLTLCG